MIVSINQTSVFFEIISMQQNPVPRQLVSAMYIKYIPKGEGVIQLPQIAWAFILTFGTIQNAIKQSRTDFA